jgi:hypothetical protein
MRVVSIGLILLAHLACTAQAATHPSATTQATKLNKANATDLPKLEKDGAEATMWYQIHTKRTERTCFGQLETYDDDDNVVTTIPIIAWATHGKWSAIEINDPRLKNAAWTSVVAGPSKGEIWGILDQNLDDRQKDVLLVHSTDAGETFQIQSLAKPSENADYDSFCMDAGGHGRLTVYLDAANEKNAKAGFYHYRTTDGGRTWSSAQYEPDGTAPADDVPDDDQPDESAKPVQKVGDFKRVVNPRSCAPPLSRDKRFSNI